MLKEALPRMPFSRIGLLLMGGALVIGTADCAEIHEDIVNSFEQVAEEVDSRPDNDLLLADQGFQALSQGNYRDAELYLTTALEANSSNPYALLNMGVVYEKTGRIEQARDMYARVVLINPVATAVESTDEGLVGATLADIARQNLVSLSERTESLEEKELLATGDARLGILRELLEAGLITTNEYTARAPSAENSSLDTEFVLPASADVVHRLASLRLYLETDIITDRAYGFERMAILDALLPIAPPPPASSAEPIPLQPTPEASLPAAPASTATTNPANPMRVHLASYRSFDTAQKGWSELQSAHGDLLDGLSLEIGEIDLGPGQGVFFRVQAGPIDGIAAAQSLCARLKQRDLYCVPTI